MSKQDVNRASHTLIAVLVCSALAAGQSNSAAGNQKADAGVSFNFERVKAGKKLDGLLTVASETVSYSESGNSTTAPPLQCSEFLAGISLKQDNGEALLVLPTKWGSQAMRSDAGEGLSTEAILRRLKAECANPGTAHEMAYSEGISYPVAWLDHGRGRSRMKRSVGAVSVRRFSVTYSDTKYTSRNASYSCSDPHLATPRDAASCKDCLAVAGQEYAFKSADATVRSTAIFQGVKNACAAQEAGHRTELEAEARREALRQEEEARRRAAETARHVAEFRGAVRSAVRSAEEIEPFSSIRSGFDPNGPGGGYWQPTLKLPGADKCALLNSPASQNANVAAWTFACRFTSGWPSSSDFGEEVMAKSVEAALGLPYSAGEGIARMKTLFFSNPVKPTWRLYVARIDGDTVGLSIVAAQVGTAQPISATADWNVLAPMMLLAEPRCQEYKQREDERSRRQNEIKALVSEVNDLQRRSQEAMAEATAADQRAISNCSGGTGFLGGLKAVACFADRNTSQQKQGEAQQLALTLNQKQFQMNSAQLSLATLASSQLPLGCRTDGTAIVAVPGFSSKGVALPIAPISHVAAPSELGSALSVEPTVHDVMERIRLGDHGPMPVAQRSGSRGAGLPGQTTMTITNSTAYELSVFFDGPVSTKATLAPGASHDLELKPGAFRVAGRVAAADVLPFYGEETYDSSTRYSVTFYIAQ